MIYRIAHSSERQVFAKTSEFTFFHQGSKNTWERKRDWPAAAVCLSCIRPSTRARGFVGHPALPKLPFPKAVLVDAPSALLLPLVRVG